VHSHVDTQLLLLTQFAIFANLIWR
jgi:hypothetical protein